MRLAERLESDEIEVDEVLSEYTAESLILFQDKATRPPRIAETPHLKAVDLVVPSP